MSIVPGEHRSTVGEPGEHCAAGEHRMVWVSQVSIVPGEHRSSVGEPGDDRSSVGEPGQHRSSVIRCNIHRFTLKHFSHFSKKRFLESTCDFNR